MSRFNQHQALQLDRNADLCLPRPRQVKQVVQALLKERSVRVVGPDNTGKSTLLNLLASQERSSLFIHRIALSARGLFDNPRRLVDRGLRRIRNRVQQILDQELSVEALSDVSQVASLLREATGRRLCILLDDLYRYLGNGTRYSVVSELLDAFRSSPGVSWVVCDNGISELIRQAFDGDVVDVEIRCFTRKECREFFRSSFAGHRAIDKIADQVHQKTGGYPYLVMRVADRLDQRQSFEPESLNSVIEQIVEEPDKTVEKLHDFASWDKSARDLLRIFTENMSQMEVTVNDDEDLHSAARRLVSTGFFVNQSDDRRWRLRPSNAIFKQKVLRGLGFVVRTEEERRIADAPPEELPDVLRQLRKERYSHGLLFRLFSRICG